MHQQQPEFTLASALWKTIDKCMAALATLANTNPISAINFSVTFFYPSQCSHNEE